MARELSAVKLSAIKLGYGEPFDQEQRAIIDLLCRSGAIDQICLTVCAYYHDIKMNRAVDKAERRSVG